MILLVNLIAGALGANATAEVFKRHNLGLVGTTLAGVLGGGLGGHLLASLGFEALAASVASKDGLDSVALVVQAGAAGACGVAVLLLAGFARRILVR